VGVKSQENILGKNYGESAGQTALNFSKTVGRAPFVARIRGYKTTEIAINWHNVEGSKVNVFKDSVLMFIEVLRITCGACFGRYKK